MTNAKRFSVVLLCFVLSSGAALYQAQTTRDLVATTEAFLASLSPEQAAKARFEFNDEERFNWAFIPRERQGLSLKEMEPHQKSLAHAMMSAVLSYRGMIKATTIMSLEPILAELEGPDRRFPRDPELYYFSIFGEPSTTGRWGWRLEGHHVAVNVTVDGGRFVAATPAMLGSNPAEVRQGPRRGLRALGAEEDLARRLFNSLDAAQKQAAILANFDVRDIVTGNSRKAMIEGGPSGVPASRMTDSQREMLRALVEEYTNRMAPAMAAAAMEEIRRAGFDAVHFAWARSTTPREPHYYRVHGPTFLIEYDNSMNDGNHIHSVFRDLKNDFGEDVLAAHYDAYHTSTAD